MCRRISSGDPGFAVALFFLPFFLLNLPRGTTEINGSEPMESLFLILAPPLMIVWVCCFRCRTIYWAARTGMWTGGIHPLLAPPGTTGLVLLLSGQEIFEGDAGRVPYWLWLTLNLSGTPTSLVLSVLEYRHLRSIGYRFRSRPEPVPRDGPDRAIRGEPEPAQ